MQRILRVIKLIKKHGVRKGIKHLLITIKIKLREKVYEHNGTRLRYIIEDNQSDQLIIIFSACPELGIKARYNYLNLLDSHKANKLWILDEYGPYSRGCYYLGKMPEFEVSQATQHLIDSTIARLSIKKSYYVGSSKGGWAALYFALNNHNGPIVISGAQQYLLGNFLTSNMENKPLLELFEFITGKAYQPENRAQVDELNDLIRDKLNKNKQWNGKVFLHYSNKEHTFVDDIQHLISDLSKTQISFTEDISDYSDHGGVSLFFPQFLIGVLNKHYKEE
ncbi:MAG: hypothetical protein JXR56_05300 [Candidatus Cloacimonetes bacterium]|nr:hypothetical protein [Candidatus Cloacimonadota bacterium]